MGWLTAALFRAPVPIAIVCLIATITAFGGMTMLYFDDGLSSVFRSSHPAYDAFERENARFAVRDSDIAIHLRSDGFADSVTLEAARQFVLELSVEPGISGTASVFDLRAQNETGEIAGPVIGAEPGAAGDYAEALQRAADHPLNQGRFISGDLAHLFVIARTEAETLTDFSGIASRIDRLVEDVLAGTGVSATASGLPMLRSRVIEDIINDQTVMNGVGAVAGFCFMLLAFRGLVPALIAGLPAVISLFWVLGFLGFSGIGINTLTNALPVLIMVLAFADSMHLTFETRKAQAAGLDLRQSIAKALRIAGPPCVLTSLTTALAFAALFLSSSELVRSLALGGLISVFITLVAVLVLNPLFTLGLSRFESGRKRAAPGRAPILFPHVLWRRCLDTVLAHRRVISGAAIGLTAVSVMIYATVEPRYSFLENVDPDAAELQDMRDIENRFLPMSSVSLIVPIGEPASDGIKETDLARIGDIHEALEGQYGADNVLSLWTAALWLEPDAPASAAQRLSQLADQAIGGDAGLFLANDGSAARIEVLTKDIGSRQFKRMSAQMEAIAADAATSPAGPATAGGLMVMAAEVSSTMISDLTTSFLAAVGFSGIVIALWCRSLRIGLLALVVNVLPIALVGAWLELSGRGLQFTSGLALTIAFGIAVDDTLHVLGRLRSRLVAGEPLGEDDIRAAFTSVAPVLLATTVILAVGIASALLSHMPTIVFFGQLSIAVFILALLADLFVLPALLATFSRRGIR